MPKYGTACITQLGLTSALNLVNLTKLLSLTTLLLLRSAFLLHYCNIYKNIATGETSQAITNLDIYFNSNPCHQKDNNKLASLVDAIAISNLKLSMTHPLTD